MEGEEIRDVRTTEWDDGGNITITLVGRQVVINQDFRSVWTYGVEVRVFYPTGWERVEKTWSESCQSPDQVEWFLRGVLAMAQLRGMPQPSLPTIDRSSGRPSPLPKV